MLLLDHDEHTFALLGDEAGYHFLRHILCRIIQQLFKLQGGEPMDHFVFPLNRVRVRHLKLIKPVLFFVHILDQAATSVGHLTEPIG